MASFNRARTRSRTNHPSLSKDEIDQVVDLVFQQNRIIESPEKASKIKVGLVNLSTEVCGYSIPIGRDYRPFDGKDH